MTPEEINELIRQERDVDHWGDREQDIETEREYDDYKDFYPDRYE